MQEGVPVLTYNEQTGEKEYKPVLKTTSRVTQRMCILEFAGGQTLEVTPEHRFFSGGEWIPVEDLEAGSILKTKNNDYLVIENKTIIPTFTEVFNIEVLDNENYFVTEDGILVHNGYKPKAKVNEVDVSTHDVEVTISRSDYPETASHIEDSIASGKPDIVEINRGGATANRKDSLAGIDTKTGFDRDEWPMAMFKEGGSGADVRYINPSDNRGAGSAIGNALSGYPDGTIVKIIIVD